MSLKNVARQERQVTLPDGSKIAVRGLSLTDITTVVYVNEKDIAEVFNAVMATVKGGGADLTDPAKLILNMAQKFPRVTAYIVAAATGDMDAVDEAEEMPFGATMEILKSCFEQTFVTSDEAGNVFGIVISMISGGADSIAKVIESNTKKNPSP